MGEEYNFTCKHCGSHVFLYSNTWRICAACKKGDELW